MKTLTLSLVAALSILSTTAFAQITKQEMAAYEKKGFDVSIGSINFNAGPSSLEIPGNYICTDGTYLRAGKIQMCDAYDGEYSTNGNDCDGTLITYDLKTPIHYMYTPTTPEGGIPDSQDGIPVASTMPLSVYVLVSNDGPWSEGGPSGNVARTFYKFPACAK